MVNFVRSKVIEKYKTNWADSLLENRNGHTGKLRTYSLYKHRLCREPYLKYIKDKEERRCYTHLRISCHKLEIEVGHYMKISSESRFYQICKSGKVGDETHFITECHVFTDERNMLFYNISKVCKNCNLLKVSNGAKIRNRYNQVPHLTQDTNGKVTNSQKTPQTRAKRSALSQQVTTKHI